jgi:P4 family phage/plasmid primase-like protien
MPRKKKEVAPVQEEVIEEVVEEVQEKNPDYVGYEAYIKDFIGVSSAEQLQAISDGSRDYNIPKGEAKRLMNEKIKEIKDKEKAKIKERLQLEAEEKKRIKEDERERKKAEENAIKEDKKKEKERIKAEREAEENANEQIKKMLLDNLEQNWQTCSDDIFQNVCEADWRKAKYYFAKRLLHENTFVEDEKEIVGLKTFQDNKDMIIYNQQTGCYEQEGDIILSAEIEKRLGEKATNMQVKEIIDSIKRQTYYDRNDLEETNKLGLRPIGNGIWDIKQKKLIPFSPRYVFLNKVEWNYNPTADYSRFKIFLKEILSGCEKRVNVVQEWLGYCLLFDVRFGKALLLYGDGENGKSVLLNVNKKLLGDKNVVSISLQYLENNPFAPVRLFGKSANIFADLPKKALSQTSVFKMLVTGDTLSGEKKGKDSFEFNPYCKQMFSCNEPPRTPDRTRGFFRRWIILEFKEHYPEGDLRRDEQLFEKLTTKEGMEGILKFALEGLYRLLEQKRFTEHMSRAEIEDFWLRHSDSVAAFTLDQIELDPTAEEKKADVFNTYEIYCRNNGYPLEEPNSFWRRFKEIVECHEYSPKNENGVQVRAIKGIRLKALKSDEPTENENSEEDLQKNG